jgi:outer membrane protein OmpA-like peptidoglycan-associated protein
MEALKLSTERIRAAIRLAGALLLSVWASAPAGAHEKEAVDKRTMAQADDAVFAGNSAQLNADGSERLDKLASFLDDHPYRVARIESSAACKASAGYDTTLSERRSTAVASSPHPTRHCQRSAICSRIGAN